MRSWLLTGLLIVSSHASPKDTKKPEAPDTRVTVSTPERARDRRSDELLRAADNARAQQAKTLQSGEAAGWRHIEARNRLLAGLIGTGPVKVEVQQLAEAASRDGSLSAQQRFELAVLKDIAVRKNLKFSSREEWLAHREASARRLIADYPEVDSAHENLLAITTLRRASGQEAALQEIVASAAPESVKETARTLLLRSSMDGRSLAEVLAESPGRAEWLNVLKQRRTLVLYTWRPDDSTSVEKAKALAAALPAQSVVYGINLGPDGNAALAMAEAQRLPGEQFARGQGRDHPLVRRLALTKPAMLYWVDHDGQIHTCSETTDLSAAFTLGK